MNAQSNRHSGMFPSGQETGWICLLDDDVAVADERREMVDVCAPPVMAGTAANPVPNVRVTGLVTCLYSWWAILGLNQ